MSQHYKYSTRELELGIGYQGSYHSDFSDSAYIQISNLDRQLSEGDIITIFSQYGEVIDFLLVRRKNGEPIGKAFLCYQDQRSTILAVDNFNNIQLGQSTIQVSHEKHFQRHYIPLDEENEALDTDPNYIPLNALGLPLLSPSETAPQPWANWDPETTYENNKYVPPPPTPTKGPTGPKITSFTEILNKSKKSHKQIRYGSKKS